MVALTDFQVRRGGLMNSNAYDLTDRVAIVTGGGTGIGAATARLLARYGADVVIASRSVEELQKTAKAIHDATGRRCVAVPTDVKEEEQVVRMVQRTADEFGRIDILINNAGGTRMGPLSGLTTKAWDASFSLNARSAYFCTREVGRHLMAQRSGAIVNVSSGAGINGVRGGAHYAGRLSHRVSTWILQRAHDARATARPFRFCFARRRGSKRASHAKRRCKLRNSRRLESLDLMEQQLRGGLPYFLSGLRNRRERGIEQG
jgi:hypothetical protein